MHRIIKKYPNRRLYDTLISHYITFEEIKNLVMQHIPFKVIDARTEEDVTNQVLLQIINEQESLTKAPIFTAEILQNIIRFYNSPYQHMMSQYLEQGLNLFTKKQLNLQASMQDLLEKTPLNLMTHLTKQQLSFWQATFEKIFNANPQNDKPK